jgi:hypothetical protein
MPKITYTDYKKITAPTSPNSAPIVRLGLPALEVPVSITFPLTPQLTPKHGASPNAVPVAVVVGLGVAVINEPCWS